MRTRNAESPTEKSPKTPGRPPGKTTPKSGGSGGKAARKQSGSRAAATSVSPSAAPETRPEPAIVEELATQADTVKSTDLKSGEAVKGAEKVEEASEEPLPLDAKEEDEGNEKEEKEEDPNVEMIMPVNVDDSGKTEGVAESGKQLMEENSDELMEPVNEEFVEEQGVPRVEEYEQMEILDMAQRRKVKKEQEIFVGGLNRDAVEEDIKAAFEKISEVVEVRLHKDFVTNKNKGFAFVKFANKEQATRALLELKNPIIRGKRCGIAPREDNDALFLGNICNTWTKEAVKQKLQDYGINGVENITLVPDTQNEGVNRGFAFLEFACHEDAMQAYKRLQKPDVVFGHPERTAKVAFADPLREPDPEIMAQVKSVFLDGIPAHWDEDILKEQLKGYGDIERVALARNMSNSKRKDFGFVNFTTHEAAVACVKGVNSTELSDGKSKVKARARLENPLPKTHAVRGGMSGGFRIGYSGIGTYSRFGGRGFGRGGFQGGRGFNSRGRGRGGLFSGSDNYYESFPSDFRGRRPFGFSGGRRGFSSSFRPVTYSRGRGDSFASRRSAYLAEEDYNRPFGAGYLGEDPYYYGDVWNGHGHRHGVKRPFSMMDNEAAYMEPVNTLRPRYDNQDLVPRGPQYRGMGGSYSRDYYYSDYGGNSYSMYGGGHPRGVPRGGYYY